jgi:hypothetical protein
VPSIAAMTRTREYKYRPHNHLTLQLQHQQHLLSQPIPREANHKQSHESPTPLCNLEMHYTTVFSVAFFVAGIFASPTADKLFRRADCSQILPACFGGTIVGQTNCRCDGQIPTCDVWTCPGDDVVSNSSSNTQNCSGGGMDASAVLIMYRWFVARKAQAASGFENWHQLFGRSNGG